MTTSTSDALAPLSAIPEVQTAVNEARVAIDRLRMHRSQRGHAARLASESALHGAAGAASLELGDAGALSVDEVRALATATDIRTPLDPTATTARGALRTYGELHVLGTTWARSPLQVLARLHVLAARGTVADSALGRPRSATDDPEAGPDIDITGRLRYLADVLATTRVPALVVAAVVHAEIATMRPFVSDNTIVALAAQRLVLASRGLDEGLQGVPEVGHLHSVEAYESALASYTAGTATGVTVWVRHVADAVIAGAQQGLAIGEALVRS